MVLAHGWARASGCGSTLTQVSGRPVKVSKPYCKQTVLSVRYQETSSECSAWQDLKHTTGVQLVLQWSRLNLAAMLAVIPTAHTSMSSKFDVPQKT